MLVPSSLYSDKGSLELRELLLDRCQWTHIYVFQNERFVFADVHHSFKIAVLTYGKGGQTGVLKTRFRIGPGDSPEADEVAEDIRDDARYLTLAVDTIRELSPKTRSILEVRTNRDLRALTKMYGNSVLLGDDGPGGWGIKYAQGDFNMTSDSKLFIARDKAEAAGFVADEYGRWVDPGGEVLLPLAQGGMIQHCDSAAQGWGLPGEPEGLWTAHQVEPDNRWKKFRPKYVMSQAAATGQGIDPGRGIVCYRRISQTTNARTWVGALLPGIPAGDSLFFLATKEQFSAQLTGLTNSLAFDWLVRNRLAGLNLSWFIVEELAVPPPAVAGHLQRIAFQLNATTALLAPFGLTIGQPTALALRALTPANRLRLRATLDAAVAALYGLDRDDLHWILRDCDHPIAAVTSKPFARTLDPKGFWRVDKTQPPELRHPVLTLVAFDDLLAHIAANGGDRDAGLHAFLNQNDGEGWQLPTTLRLADHALGHDDRALTAQPVASALGPLYLDWQLSQTPEESWAECERHARAILGEAEFALRFGPAADGLPAATDAPKPAPLVDLFGDAVQVDLFGVPVKAGSRKR